MDLSRRLRPSGFLWCNFLQSASKMVIKHNEVTCQRTLVKLAISKMPSVIPLESAEDFLFL
jgi:hypothetical protein